MERFQGKERDVWSETDRHTVRGKKLMNSLLLFAVLVEQKHFYLWRKTQNIGSSHMLPPIIAQRGCKIPGEPQQEDPKDVHVLNLRLCEYIVVKGTLQMWLRCRDGRIILVYLVGPKSSQRSLQRRTKEGPLQRKSRRIRVRERQREIWRCYDAGFKDEGKGHESTWEKPGMDSPLEIPEEI